MPGRYQDELYVFFSQPVFLSYEGRIYAYQHQVIAFGSRYASNLPTSSWGFEIVAFG